MKSFRIISLAAFSMLAFAACQQAEIAPEETPDATHTVTFVAGAPETKTTVDISSDDKSANFAWTENDVNRFTVYENGTAATKTIGVLGKDRKMTLSATFDGLTPEGENTYVATLNSSNGGQIMSAEAYDEGADILVSKAVSAFDGNNGVQLQFKREVAIAKMTLKGLDAGEVVNKVTVSSTADIAGSYRVEGWASRAKSLEISSASYKGVTKGYRIVASDAGEAVVWFTCIPQADATLTVKVEAADGDTYTKKFRKAISLTRGDVKGFGVAMEKDAKVTPSYTIVFLNSSAGAGTTLNTTTKAETVIEEGLDYVLSQPFTQKTNCYYGGEQPLRVGKSGGAGSLVIALSELGQVPATKIILSAKQYSSGKTMAIGVNGSNKQQPGEDYTDLSYDLDGTTISSIALDTDGYIYVKSITVEYGGTIKTALEAPTNLAVSAEKVVSWDAVDGASSYVLTIGTEEYPCTSNSYDASAIEDEYYDVAVVAVPTDTENYKNSAAATLPDAKFGTPTLATPTLKKGAVDELSVNTTWTVDARATEGYNCELYNGESKVGDSKTVTTGSVTFDGLEDGVTYTIKVNAIAVAGTKAYAASPVASIELTTKGTTKISEINAIGTYTVKNAVVYAIPNSYTAIISDGTGMMLLNDDNKHGFSIGAQLLTIAGTVEVTNGIYQFKNPSSTKASEDLVTPNFGDPVEATAEYLASKPNKIVYVHLKGSQSGRYISVGSGSSIQKLYLNATYSSTDNKNIEAYGFIYGYNESYSNTHFVATSITEDPTAPKLTVSPTSKTWESVEVDAATFTVKTNTEGVKDWSVSPETLDWATIAVDKDKGTITVTPKDANTNKTPREATLTVTHSADNSLTEIIKLTQKATGSTGSGEITATLSITSSVTSSGITLTDNQNNSWTFTTDGELTGSNSYIQAGTNKKSVSYVKLVSSGLTGKKIKSIELWGTAKANTNVTPKIIIGSTPLGEGSIYTTQNASSGGSQFKVSNTNDITGEITLEISRPTSATGAIYFNKAIIIYE